MDSVRFRVSNDDGKTVNLQYCAELAHKPAGHGVLVWNAAASRFESQAPEAVLRLAEAFVKSHLEKNRRSLAAGS